MCAILARKHLLREPGVCKYYIGPIGLIGDLSLSTATAAG